MYIKNFNSIKLQPLPIKKGGLFEKKIELTEEKRKMNSYEHTYITKADLTESQNKKLIDKYTDIITKNSGKVLKTEEWGLRTLSHQIKNNRKGFYFHIKFEGDGKTIEELENSENIDKNLIRFLTLRVKKHDLETNFFDRKEVQKIIGKDEKEKEK